MMYGELGNCDKPGEECGVFGIYSRPDAGEIPDTAALTYLGLYALQHRGQESAGIAVSDGSRVECHKGMGLVSEVFPEGPPANLRGHLAVGHVRYSTAGSSALHNAQPLVAQSSKGTMALAHNGHLTNAFSLKQDLMNQGSVFQTTTDSEVFLNLVARGRGDMEEAVEEAVPELRGAFAFVLMNEEKLVAVRDPMGIRPLCIGRLGDAWVVSSETCGLSAVGAEFVRDIAPGEILVIDQDGPRTRKIIDSPRKAFCVFEYIYFARGDSEFDGTSVHETRKAIGAELAVEHPVEADLVIPAPDSGISAALGYAAKSGIPFEMGLLKNRYIGRTFIQPTQVQRDLGVRIKLSPITGVLREKRVVVVDDSIVRGTTSARTVAVLRDAGAREVHLRVASPPYLYPCSYGIDTPDRSELLAAGRSVEEVKRFVRADSLAYLSLAGLLRAIERNGNELCLACLNGEYPGNSQKR